MISKETVLGILTEKLTETDMFPVYVSVDGSNKIIIEVDSDSGMSIQKCIDVSRAVEHSLDREAEDFELQVTSPGIDKPLVLPRQYVKNIGRTLRTVLPNGEATEGILKTANDEEFVLQCVEIEKIKGKKVKKEVEFSFNYKNIKESKLVIKF